MWVGSFPEGPGPAPCPLEAGVIYSEADTFSWLGCPLLTGGGLLEGSRVSFSLSLSKVLDGTLLCPRGPGGGRHGGGGSLAGLSSLQQVSVSTS